MHLAAMGGSPPVTAIEDVFSAYTYTGNGSTQTITNGIDLAGKGGMVWCKDRSFVDSHMLVDTVGSYAQSTNSTSWGFSNFVSSFNSNGFSLTAQNSAATNYVSWAFRQAAKFFKVVQVTVSGSNQTVDLSSLGTVGMVTVKGTDSIGAWYTFHRSCTSGKLVYLNTTAAETTDGSITLSGTTLTLVQSVIGNGTYIVYAWAHDTGTDGLIQCGSYSFNSNLVLTLGWEPQFLLIKAITDGAPVSDWTVIDTTRMFVNSGNNGSYNPGLWANLISAESAASPGWPTSTGVYLPGNASTDSTGISYIYLAIRRGPMKKPTVGTQVYNAVARTGTNAAATVTGVGFPLDLIFGTARTGTTHFSAVSKLLGRSQVLYFDSTAGEVVSGSLYDVTSFDMDGYSLGYDSYTKLNSNALGIISYCFRRYPGVFDAVCDTGTGSTRTITHNLGVVPELIIRKSRTTDYNWAVYAGDATKYLYLNTTGAYGASSTVWGDTSPTSSVFTVASAGFTNATSEPFVTYLFATLAGISKVGSYTGNGSSQTINCGFTTGARFILIKRTDNTGDWYVWDSTRGIVSGNDPHLSLNTTAAEVTTDDSIDPDTSGFIVNELTATHINVNAATYIYLAFA